MTTYRIARINNELLRSIAELLQTRVKKEHVQEAILTNVEASRDFGHARIYYTLVNADKRDTVQRALESAAGQIRSALGKEMRLRTIPELHFIYDESELKAREMDDLLDRIASRDA